MKSDFLKYAPIFSFALLIFVCCPLQDLESFPLDTDIYCGPPEDPNDTVFGIPLRTYSIHGGMIKRNQFLSDLLGDCNVEYRTVHQLIQKSKGIFDVRNLKAGRPYTILSDDQEEKAQFMIYEANPEEFVVFDLRGEVLVEMKKKSIEKVTRVASGVIESSLYLTLEENNLSPKLAIRLSEIYAWTIDFFHLQKGDRFKIIYEEKFAEGEYIGVEDIKAAIFEHAGQELNAFYFEGTDFPDFYAENGASLRRAFLRAPVKFSRISSGYTKRRFHPVQKRFKSHLGTDYAAPKGTPIVATADGTISHATYKKYNGNYVKVRHNSVYTTQYLHMSKIGKGIKPGKRVKQGEVIGYVGSTGLATGPHVCYRFWKNGKQVDPYRQDLPKTKPLSADLMPQFLPVVEEYQAQLDAIDYPGEEWVNAFY